MSIPALLFRWLHGRPFYRQAHREAVALLGAGRGRTWLDVGCGPGLVARLAAEAGFDSTGIDANPAMVRAATRVGGGPRFVLGSLGEPGVADADVVSAASLLHVLEDRAAGLAKLWRLVRPGGSLLVIETTEAMHAQNLRWDHHPGLRLWASVRQGRAVDGSIFDALDADVRSVDLLEGMLAAHVFTRAGAARAGCDEGDEQRPRL